MIPIRFCVGYFGGKPGRKWFDPWAWKEFASCYGVNLAGARRPGLAAGLGGWPGLAAGLAWLARLGGWRCFPCAWRVGEGAGAGRESEPGPGRLGVGLRHFQGYRTLVASRRVAARCWSRRLDISASVYSNPENALAAPRIVPKLTLYGTQAGNLVLVPVLCVDQLGAGGEGEYNRIRYGQRCSNSAFKAAQVMPSRRSWSSVASRWSSSARCAAVRGSWSSSRLSQSCEINVRRSGGVRRTSSSWVSKSMRRG